MEANRAYAICDSVCVHLRVLAGIAVFANLESRVKRLPRSQVLDRS